MRGPLHGTACALLLALALVGSAWLERASAQAPAAPGPVYELRFEARIVPSERIARAEIRLGKGASAVHWIRLRIDPERHLDFSGDGELEMGEGTLLWTPPRTGGRLRYVFRIDHLRTASSYDARCADNWALFRGGDLFPPARVSMDDGARSRSTLRFRVPARWAVTVPWPREGSSRSLFAIDNPDRSFDRPTGWMVMGRLGVLREEIAGSQITVSGPTGQGLRRHDLLAFLRWTLPSVKEAFGSLPERLLVVGAGDPMWRGGLSGPHSIYLHAARPLIAYDTTSPVLHEIVHAAMGARSGPEGDWVVEGLAEFYALELLARSGTLSRERVDRAFRKLAQRGQDAGRLYVEHASGDVTARAATLMRVLDRELRSGAGEQGASLDDVVLRLRQWDRAVTPGLLRAAAEQVADRSLADFFRRETGRAPALPDPLPIFVDAGAPQAEAAPPEAAAP